MTITTMPASVKPEPIDDIFARALHYLLAAHCAPAVVRAVEAGDSPRAAQDLWQAISDSGFANAMVPEDQGGAGLSLAQAFPLFELCGRFVVPLPLAETLLARAWAARRGIEWPDACVGLEWVAAAAQLNGNVNAQVNTAASPDVRAMQAAVVAAQMGGALQRVLEMTLQYANERQQFGRALGKFQAIQHQLAQMAEHCLAAHMAAQIGCASAPDSSTEAPAFMPNRLNAGIAKARASEAAVVVADLAHSIHGAIGFTEVFDLQLFTRRLHAWRQTAGAESYWHREIGAALVHGHDGPALDLLRQATDPHLGAA